MKTLLAVIVVTLLAVITGKAEAIPIAHTVASTQQTIVGYTYVTKTYNGWGGGKLGIFGKKKKTLAIPVYAVSAVPESSTYGMLLAGLGLVALRVKRRGN